MSTTSEGPGGQSPAPSAERSLFAIIGHDGPDGTARRDANRTEHVAFIEALDKAGQITFAGPMKSEDGKVSNGVVILLAAESLDEARRIAHEDPYVKAGVYEVLSVVPIRKVFPRG